MRKDQAASSDQLKGHGKVTQPMHHAQHARGTMPYPALPSHAATTSLPPNHAAYGHDAPPVSKPADAACTLPLAGTHMWLHQRSLPHFKNRELTMTSKLTSLGAHVFSRLPAAPSTAQAPAGNPTLLPSGGAVAGSSKTGTGHMGHNRQQPSQQARPGAATAPAQPFQCTHVVVGAGGFSDAAHIHRLLDEITWAMEAASGLSSPAQQPGTLRGTKPAAGNTPGASFVVNKASSTAGRPTLSGKTSSGPQRQGSGGANGTCQSAMRVAPGNAAHLGRAGSGTHPAAAPVSPAKLLDRGRPAAPAGQRSALTSTRTQAARGPSAAVSNRAPAAVAEGGAGGQGGHAAGKGPGGNVSQGGSNSARVPAPLVVKEEWVSACLAAKSRVGEGSYLVTRPESCMGPGAGAGQVVLPGRMPPAHPRPAEDAHFKQ